MSGAHVSGRASGISYREQTPPKEMIGLGDEMTKLGAEFARVVEKYHLAPSMIAHALVESYGAKRPRH